MDECPQHKEHMKEIREKLDQILTRLGTGDVTLATLGVRLDHVEKVVFGTVGVALTALAGAIFSIVMKN